jgi:hypothetical protein
MAAPLPTFASSPSALAGLRDIDDFLTELKEEEEANEPQNNDELDEQGQKTLLELQKWAEENPEEFAAMVASDDEAYSDEPDETEYVSQDSAYCPDPNSPAFLWEAAARKKKKKRGPRCTPAVLKTNISTCCLLFVRTKLGLPPNPRSVHARDYGSVLARNGYCTIKTTPRKAPVGAVLVYSGGASGHIELKRGPNAYWWGPTNTGPATEWKSKKRTLKAVYVKCGKSKKK